MVTDNMISFYSQIDSEFNQQSVGSTSNGVPLSGLIGFAPQFESQESRHFHKCAEEWVLIMLNAC